MTLLAWLLPKLAVFVVAAAIGGAGVLVATTAFEPRGPVTTAREAPDYLLGGDSPSGEGPAAFDVVRTGTATVVDGLPPGDLALAAAALLGDAGPVAPVNPSGFPRIPPISQFDGGPLANANCTLAAGAMLARLGFGIVTTGSILRTLQDDQVGGTGLDDLEVALWRGFGVTVETGAIRPAQLRDLLAAGYGAVIQGDYSRVPPALRLQPDFTDSHAIYLDGFYPGDGEIPPAYYVVDPLGHPAAGYEGDWWPASVIEEFGTSFAGGDRIAAAWAFPPGGTPPDVVGPDVLPLPPSGGADPGATPGPTDPGASEPPAEAGDDEPPTPVFDPPLVGPATIAEVDLIPILTICLFEPKPPGCPGGLPAVFDVDGAAFPAIPVGPAIEVRFVDSDRSNVVLVGFVVDPPIPATVRFWEADGSPPTAFEASAMSAVDLGFGDPVIVARLDVLAAHTYFFQVVAGDGALATASPVGTFTTAAGISLFEVELGTIASPRFALEAALSPYRHLAEGAFGRAFDPLGEPVPGDCHRATVTYAIEGLDASAVLIRAFPTEEPILPGGELTLAGVLEADGPPGSGVVEIGCLASGYEYLIAIDAVGDAGGPLATELVAVP